jgi:hypothetical protein
MPIPVFSEFRCGEGAVHGNQLGWKAPSQKLAEVLQ